ncbi:MAG: thiamine phosphate synthase [Comamonadaceae bacterium]|nr:thiamine phosphate synthase [Comamonadaceae bacterium]
MNALSPEQAAQAIQTICTKYAALALPAALADERACPDNVEGAVRQACLRLGFVPIDADCLAAAWQRQTARTGQFNPRAWPSDPQDFGMAPWPRTNAFAPCPQHLGLYAVLPDAAWVGRMARAGVPTLQLRFKSDDESAIKREVTAAVQSVQDTGSLLFINDHWQAAIDAGAYGVHLGQEDIEALRPHEVQALRDAGLRLGLSTHGYAEMMRADRHSPSYLALGAVFPTTLKRMATAAQGTGRLQAYAQLMQAYPLVAIGGIDPSRMPEVLASAVGSVAVVRAIIGADHPEQAARELSEQIASRLRI